MPFQSSVENLVELGALLLLLFNFYTTAVFWVPNITPAQVEGVGVGLLLIDLGATLLLVLLLLGQHSARFVKWLARKRAQWRRWRGLPPTDSHNRFSLANLAAFGDSDSGSSFGARSFARIRRALRRRARRDDEMFDDDDDEDNGSANENDLLLQDEDIKSEFD